MATKPLSDDLKRQAVEAMNRHGSVTEAAAALGINRNTLHHRLYLAGHVQPQPRVEVGASTAELQAKIDSLKEQLAAVTQVKRWVASERKKKPAFSPKGKKLIFVPDLQIKEGVPIQHLRAIGNYIADKKPDNLVFAGDNADMPSLSSWDRGKLCFEGRRYRSDIQSANEGMSILMEPVNKARSKGWDCETDITLGNHEERILRAIQEDGRLDGLMSIKDLAYEKLGITTHEFLKVIVRNGAAFSHYFPRGASGTVGQSKRGAPNAKAQLMREGRTAFSGHQQGLEMHCQSLGGRLQWGIIAGSAYLHDEGYLTPQGNNHWRGIIVAHEMHGDGSLNPMVVGLEYLMKNYL
jgi:transposase-like protein